MGQWQEGLYHGEGELRAAEAPPLPAAAAEEQVYRGAWAYGQRHGEGRSERRDGSSYEGQWAHGRPLGRGTLLEPAAGRKYVGGVAGGARSGLGTLRLVGAGARCDEVGRGSSPRPGPSPTRLPPQAQPQP